MVYNNRALQHVIIEYWGNIVLKMYDPSLVLLFGSYKAKDFKSLKTDETSDFFFICTKKPSSMDLNTIYIFLTYR